jgi:hypothetical protein
MLDCCLIIHQILVSPLKCSFPLSLLDSTLSNPCDRLGYYLADSRFVRITLHSESDSPRGIHLRFMNRRLGFTKRRRDSLMCSVEFWISFLCSCSVDSQNVANLEQIARKILMHITNGKIDWRSGSCCWAWHKHSDVLQPSHCSGDMQIFLQASVVRRCRL